MECPRDFIETDTAFMESFSKTQSVDPISFGDTGSLLQFQTDNNLDELAIGVAQRAAMIIDRSTAHTDSVLQATYRDLDKVFGYYACRREDIPDEITTILPTSGPQSSRPRCNTYEYFLGANHNNPPHLYTGRTEEKHLIQITAAFLHGGHMALHELLRARDILHSGRSAYSELARAYVAIQDMHRAMLRSYKDVTPQFVTEVMTGRMRGVKIDGKRVEGPNASHSVSLLIDRLVVGDFDPLCKNPGMQEAISGRLIGLPPHLLALFESIDATGEEESLAELSRSSDDRAIALAIVALIRKTKVAHKSFADKGLDTKLKRDNLTQASMASFDDVLTPTIGQLRRIEESSGKKQ